MVELIANSATGNRVPDITAAIQEVREMRDRGDLKSAAMKLEILHSEYPQDPRIWQESGVIRMTAKDYKGALKLFTAAHEAYSIAEDLASRNGHKREAQLQRALTAYSAGLCCNSMGEFELGESWLEVSTTLYGEGFGSSAWGAYGSTLYMHGKPREGFLAHDRALRAPSDGAHDRFNKALIKMLRGEQEGFQEYESRFELANMKPHRYSDLPRWDGESKGWVLVVSEQGAGDAIMMERYLRGWPNCVVSVQEPLRGWFWKRGHVPLETCEEWAEGKGIPPLQLEWQIPMMSLPAIFGIRSPDTPQLAGNAPSSPKQAPKHQVPRVGICWAGNREHSNDYDRSMPPQYLAGFTHLNCELVNLTYGHPLRFTLDASDAPFKPRDYLETAELIQTLDAVISVDTSVLHLSATLGIPTIGLVPTAPEWRWGVPREGELVGKSEWYPSLTIIRRRHTNEWSGAIQRAVKELDNILEGR